MLSINKFLLFLLFLIGLLLIPDQSGYAITSSPQFIEIQLSDRLGNQMFQYAAAQAYAWKHNKQLYVTPSKDNPENALFNVFNLPALISDKKMTFLCSYSQKNKCTANTTKSLRTFNKSTYDNPNYLFFKGHAQDWHWFYEYQDQIKRLFRFSKPLSKQNQKWKKQIQHTQSVAVHIRRGDYLQHKNVYILVSKDYYQQAFQYISKHLDKPHLYIFSDDIEWAKKNITTPLPHDFIDNNQNDPGADLHLMALCKHHIIANSTFSWWGSFLAETPHQIVVAPAGWKTGIKSLLKNVLRPGWVLIDNHGKISS